ncbi:Ivy family c-type lysozyme inhibitor [Roseiarcaceae bacterium H3SJ34-1]|uniref:Ivy family c-type lysozyme inhibitor n=1 Tax=Terripilifer ovatus TaxID=3032367 RepID=UPI003AB93E67|nr:Ivy family c-type lysozyme inhibitor [Roseiarcaceae bacterium H3SJ34-1]
MRNRFKQLSVLGLVSALMCGSAFAADEYLFDTLKKPAYRKVWNAMLAREKNIPPWIISFSNTYNGVASPVQNVTVGGKTYLSGYVCKPHDCADNALAVLFDNNGASVSGVVKQGGKLRYLGAPDAAIKAALDDAVGK